MANVATGARAVAPVRAWVPGDVATAKKGKGRVVDEKSVTRCNSACVSFENKVKNGGFFANAPTARGLRGGLHRAPLSHAGCCACAHTGSQGGPSHRSWAAR